MKTGGGYFENQQVKGVPDLTADKLISALKSYIVSSSELPEADVKCYFVKPEPDQQMSEEESAVITEAGAA